MTRPGPRDDGHTERIPFWRNVKTIGILAQLVFAAVVVAAVVVLWLNVTSALSRSNLPADFGWLDARAGVPVAERPIPYTPSDPYWRVLLIGFLNTLKVSLVGVAMASVIGVATGVARLSGNWLLRQIATWYVEVLRNTPLAVQIIFWYTAALATLPPTITNPITLPGGFYFSNRGLAFPFPYPGFAFRAWLPWLVIAVAAYLLVLWWRRRQIARAERPGRAWPAALAAFAVLAGVGYLIGARGAAAPEDLVFELNIDRGRLTSYLDRDGDGERDAAEPTVGFAPATVRIEEGMLTDRTRNLNEQRQRKPSVFRFPVVEPHEYESAELRFADPEQAERFSVHIEREPGAGWLYEDRNGDGTWQPGEETGENGDGFDGVDLELHVTGFERYLVTSRDGGSRIPRFESPAASEALAEEEAEEDGGAAAGFNLQFGSPEGEEASTLEGSVDPHVSGPLVWSRPTIPVSNYEGGFRFTPSYLALLLALVIYTSSFIAEIVRGGLQAVPAGQTEAAKALGLSDGQVFNLVVFPQAVRIVLPPVISQYLNLTKNSSLGPLAAYGELFAISTIVANQTGASVPVTVLLIVSYLLISFVFAFILNIVNARMAIVER
ncbi:MAG: ABC transporter permease subunit [Trueperaceae bacterium]|nr:ABC transporter permease subunit [Trueperaceae bacterium]